MKTRYTDLATFTAVIRRVYAKATESQISYLFNIIGETKKFEENEVFVVDLWVFLAVLKEANEESRRSFDFKTSRIANDVEFWNKHGAGQSASSQPNSANFHRRLHLSSQSADRRRPQSAAGEVEEVAARRSARHPQTTVAETLGAKPAANISMLCGGRHVLGSFSKERDRCSVSVRDALNFPEYPQNSRRKSSQQLCLHRTEDGEIVPLGRHSIKDAYDPARLEACMLEGSAVSNAIYGRSTSPPRGQKKAQLRATSKGGLLKEGGNETTVATALGYYREDNRGRTSSPSDHRRQVSTM
jgi:hypothetical protein